MLQHVYSSVIGLSFQINSVVVWVEAADILEVAILASVGECVLWQIAITTIFYMVCVSNST